MKYLVVILLIFTTSLTAQNSPKPELNASNALTIPADDQVKISLEPNNMNEDMRTLFQFENISQYEFKFDGNAVKNKNFVLRMKEFRDGKLVNTETLFDEGYNRILKVDSTSFSLKLLTKVEGTDLKVWLKGSRFGSKKTHFKLDENNATRYVTKDFMGSIDHHTLNINEPFYLLATITPYIKEDGSGQYCQVAYSGMDPEDFGKNFDIPHYFLIQMEFTEEE